MNATAYRVAARSLLADQGKAAPKKVDDLFKEVKDGNPSYSDEQAWATAWSIYCKHVDPNGEHCHKGPGGYLKEANDAARVRQLLTKSIKHMKDIIGPNWEKFAKKNPGLAAASIHMAAQDAIRVMEDADKLLASMPKQAAEGSIERPTPSSTMNQLAAGEGFHDIKPGDRVTIKTPHGQEISGRAVMKGPHGWVLNLGGAHGRPGIATPENVVKVKSMGGKSNAWGIG